MDTEQRMIAACPKLILALVESNKVLGEIATSNSKYADMAWVAFVNNVNAVLGDQKSEKNG